MTPSKYEQEYGRPIPDGYVEVSEPNGMYTLYAADGRALSAHEANIIFRAPGTPAPERTTPPKPQD